MEFLRVSDNGHYFMTTSGKPFFWLGDTAWELFHRLSREEADIYLTNRAAKGFNVIQAVILAERDGLRVPNVYGDLPLNNDDPTTINEAYFAYVDEVIQLAAAKGLYIGLLPTWGDKVDLVGGTGPVIFNADNAYAYGQLVGERYRHQSNILWILGGDRFAEGFEPVWQAMAQGILAGTAHNALITYHPRGPGHSSTTFHDESWLSFNLIQSGHGEYDIPNWAWIAKDYQRLPPKPVLDSEPNYENHPVAFSKELRLGRFSDYDVRKAAYRAVLAGACGHTYGHHSIWQMYKYDEAGVLIPEISWHDALDASGAFHVGHLRRLIESRPFFSRIPDNSLVLGNDSRPQPICASRDADGSYAFVYIPLANETITIDMHALVGSRFQASWYDPRSGTATTIETFDRAPQKSFTTPAAGLDWVLVIDSLDHNFPPPGQPSTDS